MRSAQFLFFITLALFALSDLVLAAVVKHSSGSIRKPLVVKADGARAVRRSEEPAIPSEPGVMIITTQSIGVPLDVGGHSSPCGSEDEMPADANSVTVEMMVIGMEEPSPQATRRVARKFGSNPPLFIEQSPRLYGAQNEDLELSNVIEGQMVDGLRQMLQRMLTEGDTQDSLKLANALKSGSAKSKDTMSSSPPSSLNSEATKSQPSPPQSAAEADPKPTESVSFSPNSNKQILLGSAPSFDNTSHHSQL